MAKENQPWPDQLISMILKVRLFLSLSESPEKRTHPSSQTRYAMKII